MSAFGNNPRFNSSRPKGRISHSPMEGDHYDIHYKLAADGIITLSRPTGKTFYDGSVETDEISIPAGLVIKLNDVLRITRKIDYSSTLVQMKKE